MAEQPSTELLIAQAEFLDYPPEVYLRSSIKEREAAKEIFLRDYCQKIRARKGCTIAEARKLTETHMTDFPMSEQQLTKTNSKQIRKKMTSRRKTPELEVIDDEEEEEDFQVQKDPEGKEVKVYHNQGVLPNNIKVSERDGPTTGPIRERVPAPIDDLVGDRPPRTLLDLYARWPIAEDSDFFLRIERTLPKRYQGVVTTGLVGEIRGRRVSEADIQRMFGGQEYKVTLYGPDPRNRGAVEADGSPKVKALTDPITITVPILPPNLSALPSVNQEPTPMNQMNPFGPTAAGPTTVGDATVVKASAGFFADAMKMQASESQRREAESGKATSHLISFMSESNKTQLEQVKEEQRRRDAAYEKELEALKAQVEREKAAQTEIATRVAKEKDKSNEALMELYKVMGPDKQAEVQRLSEYYREQTDIIRRSHADQLQSLQMRHEADLRRADERLKDTEMNYRQILEQERTQSRQMLDQERSQWSQRESDLRTQMERQTENERKMAQQRIDDMKERHEAEVRGLEKAHERELRTLKEAEGVKFSVAQQTSEMSREHLNERLQDAREEVERIREEVAEAKDLSKQLEAMERQAELLGFEKKDANEPKTPWERFAATAGAGLSQVLSTANEWLPAVMAERQQNAAARALPPAQPQQQRMRPPMPQQHPQQVNPQQQPSQRRRASGAEWAAEGVSVRPEPQPEPGFRHPAPEPVKTPVQPVAQEQNVTQNPQETEDKPLNGSEMKIAFSEKFLQFFPPEALMGFLQSAEQAINNQVDPSGFAELMVNSPYSAGARALVSNFTPEELSKEVENIPGTESSPLLRRDGKRWMERLFRALKSALPKEESQPEAAPQ